MEINNIKLQNIRDGVNHFLDIDLKHKVYKNTNFIKISYIFDINNKYYTNQGVLISEYEGWLKDVKNKRVVNINNSIKYVFNLDIKNQHKDYIINQINQNIKNNDLLKFKNLSTFFYDKYNISYEKQKVYSEKLMSLFEYLENMFFDVIFYSDVDMHDLYLYKMNNLCYLLFVPFKDVSNKEIFLIQEKSVKEVINKMRSFSL